jgi:hypothetical protein
VPEAPSGLAVVKTNPRQVAGLKKVWLWAARREITDEQDDRSQRSIKDVNPWVIALEAQTWWRRRSVRQSLKELLVTSASL